jgi:hypothetical protein
MKPIKKIVNVPELTIKNVSSKMSAEIKNKVKHY